MRDSASHRRNNPDQGRYPDWRRAAPRLTACWGWRPWNATHLRRRPSVTLERRQQVATPRYGLNDFLTRVTKGHPHIANAHVARRE
jgi:hypothetical protein